MLVCRECEAREDTLVRLEEIASMDWRETPERPEDRSDRISL
jgi:hypothetical protein